MNAIGAAHETADLKQRIERAGLHLQKGLFLLPLKRLGEFVQSGLENIRVGFRHHPQARLLFLLISAPLGHKIGKDLFLKMPQAQPLRVRLQPVSGIEAFHVCLRGAL